MTRAEVPPAGCFVFGGCGEDVIVWVPDDGLYGEGVLVGSDFDASV